MHVAHVDVNRRSAPQQLTTHDVGTHLGVHDSDGDEAVALTDPTFEPQRSFPVFVNDVAIAKPTRGHPEPEVVPWYRH